jgi:hypothetical protein
MQLLLVHSDAELGHQLMQMVKDYTDYQCDLVSRDSAAVDWAKQNKNCDLLLTQLDARGVDGFQLGGSFTEFFPKVQTGFFPGYSALEQRLEVSDTKVFPEPIDGEKMLNAIDRAGATAAEGRDLFHALDLLQMSCLARKSGAIQMVFGQKIGIVYLRDGTIVEAETAKTNAKDALYEMAGWNSVEFAYDASVAVPIRSITRPWHEILIEAVVRSKQRKVTARS